MNQIFRLTLLVIFTISSICKLDAQKIISLGSHSKKGNGHINVIKGEGIGTLFKIGSKPKKIVSLSLDVIDGHPDSISYFIRIFKMNGKTLGNNVMSEYVFKSSLANNEINVNLEKFNIVVEGSIMVAIEFESDARGEFNRFNFHTGLLKKGIYFKSAGKSNWKKLPLWGLNLILKVVSFETT